MTLSRPGGVEILPPVAPAVIEVLNQKNAQEATRGRQIGFSRPFDEPIILDATTKPADWFVASNGWRVWSAQVASAGAMGMRLHFEKATLPPGVKLVIYDPATPGAAAVVIDAANFGTAPELWAPTLFAEQARVECQAAPGVDLKRVAFSISGLSHIYQSPQAPSSLKEGACENDASCYPDYAAEAKGVAMITYVHGGNTYLCTGCLLATRQPKVEEYFLTARHCIGSQSLASTLEFYWFFQTPGCGAAPPLVTSVPKTTGGADLLMTGITDFTFLRLRHPAPAGVFFLGWTLKTPAVGESMAGIHHPDGTFKRISFGTFFDSDIYHWAVQWSSGVTESGSSGSPLLNSEHLVTGQLGGGYNGPGSSCDNPLEPDEYGRFDVTYPAIKKWIDSDSGAGGTGMIAGTYYGLFYDQTRGPGLDSSGAMTVTTTAKGKVTGKIQLGGSTYSFTSQMDLEGNVNMTVARRNLTPLTIHFQISPLQGGDVLTGQVSSGSWTSVLNGNRAVFDGKTSFCPQAGRYTLVFHSIQDTVPAVDNYGTVTVDKTGRVTFAGALTDGTKITQSTYVSRTGQWPLYIVLGRGQGFLFSWVAFNPTASGDLAGELTLSRLSSGANAGVMNLGGSAYNRPAPGTPILKFTDGNVSFDGGGLGASLQDPIQLKPDGHVNDKGGLKMNFRFTLATGIFNGSVTPPGAKRAVTFQGVALQKQNLGSGFFKNANQAGRVLIQQ